MAVARRTESERVNSSHIYLGNKRRWKIFQHELNRYKTIQKSLCHTEFIQIWANCQDSIGRKQAEFLALAPIDIGEKERFDGTKREPVDPMRETDTRDRQESVEHQQR
eukprot:scaffold20209_cov41-Attheya_sp.AAC.2